MILSCPKCATRFFADDHAIGPSGRRVKCDACGEVWSVAGVEAESPTVDDMSKAPDLPSAADPVTDAGEVSAGATPEATPLFVERASSTRKPGARPSGRPWGLAVLALAFVVVAGVFIFQRDIERVFPGASAIYQSIGVRSSDRASG